MRPVYFISPEPCGVRASAAVVWTPYAFRIDGNVSHCGVDIFNKLKIDGQWVIGNAMWTVVSEAREKLPPRPNATIRPAELKQP